MRGVPAKSTLASTFIKQQPGDGRRSPESNAVAPQWHPSGRPSNQELPYSCGSVPAVYVSLSAHHVCSRCCPLGRQWRGLCFPLNPGSHQLCNPVSFRHGCQASHASALSSAHLVTVACRSRRSPQTFPSQCLHSAIHGASAAPPCCSRATRVRGSDVQPRPSAQCCQPVPVPPPWRTSTVSAPRPSVPLHAGGMPAAFLLRTSRAAARCTCQGLHPKP